MSLVLPAFNEAAILTDNVETLIEYLRSLEGQYRWELIIVNDGSRDRTGEIAEELAARHSFIRVVHHVTNFGLGQAFKSAFGVSSGDFVITMDMDLSYSPEHIRALLDTIRRTRAKLVLASPYMKGGKLSNVPWQRRLLSVWANRFLALVSGGSFSTLTGMTRAYDGPFIRSLNLRATSMDVMPETVYKSMVMRARIEQIPAHLDWSKQVSGGVKRRSSMRVLRHTFATVLSGFIFRPFMFFVLPGLLLLAFAAWINFWMIAHFVEAYVALDPATVDDRVTAAVAVAYERYPYTFIVGLLALMLSIQLISLGILALQAKNYFEEIFHLGTNLRRAVDRRNVN